MPNLRQPVKSQRLVDSPSQQLPTTVQDVSTFSTQAAVHIGCFSKPVGLFTPEFNRPTTSESLTILICMTNETGVCRFPADGR